MGASVDIGVALTWTCTDPAAEVGETASNSVVMTCQPDGTTAKWEPVTLDPCAVPAECGDPKPVPAVGSNLTATGTVPVKAFRALEYSCAAGQTTEQGTTFMVKSLIKS